MKEKLLMEKRNYKKGITLFEILISILIIGIISLGSYYIISRIHQINSLNDSLVDETMIIQNTYELFKDDPSNFKENIEIAYKGTWDNDIYLIEKNPIIRFKITENMEFIILKVIKDDEVIEIWKRKKEIHS